MNILAVDIGGTSIKICLVDEKGLTSNFREIDSEAMKGGPYLVENLMKVIEAHYSGFEAIGISTASQVDSDKGIIVYANENFPGYKGMNLKALFEERFNVRVKVENDVNAAALGEKFFGAGKDFEDFLCLTYGTGVGGAIVMNSTVYKGLNGIAAEVGHLVLHPGGVKCNCGCYGCYEMYGSTTALVKQAMKIDPKYTNGRKIFEGLDEGDKRLETVLENWVLEIATGLVSLTHIFNPPAIIIGGGIMEQDVLIKMVREKVLELIIDSFKDVQIMRASLGNKAGLLGAAALHM
ncbi:ROK family protein [Sporosarcina pasteurii]|uniref:Glucokinase n=1 Tax=Sporosarcina pasteurii TaxID=1474 RepID=A0A380BFN1_SPOPA|nr:ROK family protein [Sporosarcina pasteurii]MDS9472521.1 ROK family protein [Sporosarcina pasteurii]QBQ06073.1 ROK family protein [Sporosarcina pasteurii]SUI99515.1 Glucokinase [Sporosarcina pasteurii]